ncbi:unnamed protein product [Lactuca virosa]|uniref:Uncharacterized protein n=1 Tax=Lactuca virosa TaxID=75947 RepID=A0AAU9LNS8_9ASTR|nr:unnamed protein product [Lactuca virosa]
MSELSRPTLSQTTSWRALQMASKNYALVRFIGVDDAKALETSLQGPPCQRQEVPPLKASAKSNKTFAQVVVGARDQQASNPNPPITINPNTCMSRWLKINVLIGETHSLDHMGTLHASRIITEETKYHGGLRLTIHFNCPNDATKFLEDETRWKDWFKWMGKANQ